MTNAKPMTVQERAYRLGNDLANALHYLAKNRQFDDDDLPILMQHLQQACDEARAEVVEKKLEWAAAESDKAYAKGFSDAREKAAGVAKLEEWNAGDIHACCADNIAARIWALEMDK